MVDDGSTDATAEVVRALPPARLRCGCLQNPGNHGKGYSVRSGMLQALGEVVMFTDADLSAPMEEADRLFAAIAEGPISPLDRDGLRAAARRIASRFTGSFSAAVSTVLPGS